MRPYTADGRNYMQWLVDAAHRLARRACTAEQGFDDDTTPQALLYLFLRHAVLLGYYDTSYLLHRSAGFLTGAQLQAMKPEPPFVHVDPASPVSESRFAALYKTEARITGDPSLLVSDYIAANPRLPEAAGSPTSSTHWWCWRRARPPRWSGRSPSTSTPAATGSTRGCSGW